MLRVADDGEATPHPRHHERVLAAMCGAERVVAGEVASDTCALCRPQLSTPVIRQSGHWRTAINRNQNLLGKLIIVLLRHEESVAKLTPAEWAELRDELRWATERLEEAFMPDHFNYAFLQNQDRHVHLHVIPRYAGTRSIAGVEFADPDWPDHYRPGVEYTAPRDVIDAVAGALAGEAQPAGPLDMPADARQSRGMGSRPLTLRAPPGPLSDGVVALRPWSTDDVAVLVAAIDGDSEIARWLELIPQPYREPEAREWIETASRGWREGTLGAFATCSSESGEVVGGIGLRVRDAEHAVAEIGYWAAAWARGRGATTRALRLLSRWTLEEAGAERVQLRAELANLASQRVAEKAGFVREGVLGSYRFNPRLGRRMDFVFYSLLPADLDSPGGQPPR